MNIKKFPLKTPEWSQSTTCSNDAPYCLLPSCKILEIFEDQIRTKCPKCTIFFSKILVKPLFYFIDPNFMQNFRTIYPPIIPLWLNPPSAFWTWEILLQISDIIVTANQIQLLNVILSFIQSCYPKRINQCCTNFWGCLILKNFVTLIFSGWAKIKKMIIHSNT